MKYINNKIANCNGETPPKLADCKTCNFFFDCEKRKTLFTSCQDDKPKGLAVIISIAVVTIFSIIIYLSF